MIQRAIEASNASKAMVAILLNAGIEFTEAFGLYNLSERQETALAGAVNAVIMMYVLATYKLSHKRAEA